MKLSAPKMVTWIGAVVLGVLGLLSRYVSIPFVTRYDFWFVVAGLVVLVLGTLIKEL